VAEFFRGLRSELGGERFPYAWTSEWHPGGHGLHVHFTVGRYVRERLIRQVWGRGITHIKRIQDLPVGSGAVEEARRAAGYSVVAPPTPRRPGRYHSAGSQGSKYSEIRCAAGGSMFASTAIT
jgi:hypothetical protein